MNDIEWKFSKNLVDYQVALDFMEEKVENIFSSNEKELIWVLEHPDLYTAGISSDKSDLLSNELPVYSVSRGGKYTYHGPGQKVVYVMINLKQRMKPLDIRKFVKLLEEWIIKILEEFNIDAFTSEGRIGVWVNDQGLEKKIAALGIKIKKGITYHGIAINLSPNLEHFKGIIPCGIKEYGVTSIKELNKDFDSQIFDKILQKKFNEVFKCFI